MITLQQLRDLFESARNYRWDIRAPCVWDYFFTDVNRERLLGAAPALETEGFELVGLLEPTDADDDQGTLYLQVRRIEAHTPESLHELNRRLYAFADEHGLSSYDGMDVGPVAET